MAQRHDYRLNKEKTHMIIDVLITIINVVLRFIANLLPIWNLPDFILDSLDFWFSNMYLWNDAFPLVAGLKCVLLIVGFNVARMAFKIAVFIISTIRGSSAELDL